VPVPGAEPTEEAIVAHTRDHLAGYKKPQRVVFRGELPRGATGKVLKRELRSELEAERFFETRA
jgi:acyl-CoA synthetase (AMP-forming)/AMP-acid ligase II